MMHHTPDSISLQVLDLCRHINPDGKPVYITITPDGDCEANDCFECIRRKAAREGGRIQFGWSIWEWPRVYVEAEHQAVYEPPHRLPWLDITPSASPYVRRRLFLADDAATYDFGNEGVLRDNRRLAVTDDPLIQDFFHVAEKRTPILNSIPGVGAVEMDIDTATEFSRTNDAVADLVHKLGMKYTPQGAPASAAVDRSSNVAMGNSERIHTFDARF